MSAEIGFFGVVIKRALFVCRWDIMRRERERALEKKNARKEKKRKRQKERTRNEIYQENSGLCVKTS